MSTIKTKSDYSLANLIINFLALLTRIAMIAGLVIAFYEYNDRRDDRAQAEEDRVTAAQDQRDSVAAAKLARTLDLFGAWDEKQKDPVCVDCVNRVTAATDNPELWEEFFADDACVSSAVSFVNFLTRQCIESERGIYDDQLFDEYWADQVGLYYNTFIPFLDQWKLRDPTIRYSTLEAVAGGLYDDFKKRQTDQDQDGREPSETI